MTRDRVCANGGLLVDGTTRLAVDPCEYYDEAVRELVGCSRLRCTKCNAWVRTGPPGLVPSEVPDLATMYGVEDWSSVSILRRAEAAQPPRLYACRCAWWVATRADCIENDHDSEYDPDVPWTCQGHPLPELPITLGDLKVGTGTDWAALVDKILRGSCPRRLQRENSVGDEPGVWLVWLYVYLRGLPVAAKLSAAIANRVSDSDPHVVGRVLYFFTTFARADGVEGVIARAEADVHRVAVGYPIPEHHIAPTLWNVLLSRLEQRTKSRDALDARVDALVRKILLIPLSSLSHEDIGPTSLVEFERQNRVRHGKEVDTAGGKSYMRDYEELKKRERADVVLTALERFTTAFDDPDMRRFIADQIVQIDAAAKGRWRHFMNLLSDWREKPQTGHLIVTAGARVIEAGLATPDEFRDWIQARRAYGWVDASWVLPLADMLKEN